jgi:hypothetical protein
VNRLATSKHNVGAGERSAGNGMDLSGDQTAECQNHHWR